MKYTRTTITLPRANGFSSEVPFRIPEKSKDDKIALNPFAPLIVAPLTAGEHQVPGKAILLDEGGQHIHVANHTDRYVPISNAHALDVSIGLLHKTGIDASPVLGYWDGKRFSLIFILHDHAIDIRPNDRSTIGLLVQNSYDGKLVFGVRILAIRYLCTNGMFLGDSFGGFAFRHIEGTTEDIVLDAAARLPGHISNFKPVLHQLARLADTEPSRDEVLDIASRLIDGNPSWPEAAVTQGLMAYHNGEDKTLWGFLNVFTYLATHQLPPFAGLELSRVVTTTILQP